MTGAVSTFWKVNFCWSKAARKGLHENRNSQELLISTASVIKFNGKVKNLLYSKDISR